MSIANLHKLQILGLVSEKLYNVYVYQYLFLKLALAVVFCINSLRDTCDYHVGCSFPNTYTRLKECLLRLKIFYKFTKISPMKEMPPWSLHRRASLFLWPLSRPDVSQPRGQQVHQVPQHLQGALVLVPLQLRTLPLPPLLGGVQRSGGNQPRLTQPLWYTFTHIHAHSYMQLHAHKQLLW